ncbi:hypothetical protein QZH41_003601 [Actinostola sp. cb2023]|nr:hypothetical protein QZH41_003601 [Actinostola sp. cb2023]
MDRCAAQVDAIDKEVTAIEHTLEQFKEQLAIEKQNLDKGKALLLVVQQYQDGITHIANNLPAHLPGVKRESKQKASLKQQSKPSTQQQKPQKRARTNNGSGDDNIPKLQYITVEDFEAVPKYLKGRITYKQVNNAVDEINQVIKSKYRILSLPRSAMGEHVMKKYKAFKEAETDDTKDGDSSGEYDDVMVMVVVVMMMMMKYDGDEYGDSSGEYDDVMMIVMVVVMLMIVMVVEVNMMIVMVVAVAVMIL